MYKQYKTVMLHLGRPVLYVYYTYKELYNSRLIVSVSVTANKWRQADLFMDVNWNSSLNTVQR
jgi:hypothetical protein